MAKVSIIVPIYNIQNYLPECVESLRKQSFRDIQIILVDDGSTDNSGRLIDSFAVQDDRILALHKTNGGQSSARNMGFAHATGEYVLYVDGDDYIIPEAVEKLYAAAKEYDVDIVHGDLLNDADRLKDNTFRQLSFENKKAPMFPYLKEVIEKEIYDIVPFLYFVRKAYLDQHEMQFAEGYFYEDQLYTLQLLSHPEASIAKIRFPFYYYRMDRPGSTTNHMTLKKGLDAAHICDEMYKYIQKYSSPETKAVYDAVLLISLYQYYRVFLRMAFHDRKKIRRAIDLAELVNSLETTNYYRLEKELHHFLRNPEWIALNWDIKHIIRKLLGR